MSGRRKWATSFPLVPGAVRYLHRSEPAVYRYLRRHVGLWHEGILRSPMVAVWVDKGEGAGWELHQRVDLRKVQLREVQR